MPHPCHEDLLCVPFNYKMILSDGCIQQEYEYVLTFEPEDGCHESVTNFTVANATVGNVTDVFN